MPNHAPGLGIPRRPLSRTVLLVGLALLVVLDSGALISNASHSPSPSALPAASGPSSGAALLAQARASIAAGQGPTGPLVGGNASSPGAWLPVVPSSSGPPQRYLGMLAYDPSDHYVVLFGGSSSTTLSMSDTWTFVNGTWTEIYPTSSPGPRYLGVLCWDAKDGYLVMFGGYDASSNYFYNDTWTFLHGQWTNITSSSTSMPSQRWRPGMAYDAADGYVVLFGGTPANGNPLSDTWKFSGGVWTNITKNVTGSPPGRYRFSMIYDSADSYVLVFGGCTSTATSCATSDTWTYHNYTWSHLTPSVHPSARVYEAMDYDQAKGYVVLFGGSSSSYSPANMMSDTWSYLNGTWTNLTSKIPKHPGARGFEMMEFDPLDNYSIMYGGEDLNTGTYMGDTWSYGPALLGHLEPMATSLDVGQTTAFNVTAISDATYLNYSYGGLPAGCASANVSFLNCTPSASGTFPVTVNVTTPANDTLSLSVTLLVTPDPSISAFSASPATTTAGGLVTFSVLVGGGASPYQYAYSSLPSGCSSRNVWNLSCRPTTAGTYTVAVRVTDAASYPVFANTSLLVNIAPAVTTFTAFPSVLDVGQQTNFTVNAHGGTGTLTYNYSGLPSGCTSSNTARLSCQPTASGTFLPVVEVTDSVGFSATAALNLTVGLAPSIVDFAVTPAVIDAGQTVTFYLNATGGTGALSYLYSSNLAGCTFGHAAQVSCSPTGTGTFLVTGSVTDTVGMTVSQSVSLTINANPSVASVSATPSVLDAGQNVTIEVNVTGGTAPYTFVYTGLPAGCAGGSGPSTSCAPRAAGSPTISVTVTDHLGRTAQGSTFLTINPAPAVASFGANPATVSPGSTTVLTVDVTGGSGVYTYVYADLPTGCQSANTSRLRCTPSATGTYNVSVSVTDSLGATTHGYANVSVQSASATGGGFAIGGSSTLTYALIGVVAVVVIAAAVLLLRRRGGRPAGPGADGPTTEEMPPEESP